MTRVWLSTLILFSFMMVLPVRAQSVPLVADLSNHLVAITTGFTGTDVLLFGATDGPGDVVIVVRGPSIDLTLREKQRAGPIWANDGLVTFMDVPSFYRVASNRTVEDFAPERLRSRYQIGLDNLRLRTQEVDIDGGSPVGEYEKALIRLKTRQGLYEESVGNVNLMANRLFRTELHFPANVPTGTYFVEIYLFRNGDVTSAEIVPLNISKIGLGAEVYDFAHNYAPLYGILAIVIAVLAGWAAEAILRRK